MKLFDNPSNFEDLEKHYKNVKICKNQACNRKYGSDYGRLDNGYCPICIQKLHRKQGLWKVR